MGASEDPDFVNSSTPESMETDSRRPSLAYSSFSDESLTVSTPASLLSQPVTPVASGHAGRGRLSDWTGSLHIKLNMAASYDEPDLKQPLPEGFFDVHLSPSASFAAALSALTAASSSTEASNLFAVPDRLGSVNRPEFTVTQPPESDLYVHPGLKTTLFPQMYGMGPPSPVVASLNPGFIGPANGRMVPSLDTLPAPPHFSTYHQHEQVVAPSQLRSENICNMEICTSPLSRMNNAEHGSKSFDLFSATVDDCEPDSRYEACNLATANGYNCMLVDPISHDATPLQCSSRPHRNTTRCTRKANAPKSTYKKSKKQTWAEYFDATYGCQVSFEGTPFTAELSADGKVKKLNTLLPIDHGGGGGGSKHHHHRNRRSDSLISLSTTPSPSSSLSPSPPTSPTILPLGPGAFQRATTLLPTPKAHACVAPGCTMRFKRQEHLKRHAISHVTDPEQWPYFCPLANCGRRIGRSDNARDHLKTHLRPKVSGKRNATVSLAEMERRVREQYPADKAGRLLKNLGEWLVREQVKRAEKERVKGLGRGGNLRVRL